MDYFNEYMVESEAALRWQKSLFCYIRFHVLYSNKYHSVHFVMLPDVRAVRLNLVIEVNPEVGNDFSRSSKESSPVLPDHGLETEAGKVNRVVFGCTRPMEMQSNLQFIFAID